MQTRNSSVNEIGKRIGVNFYKAARLEPPPTFQTPRLSGFWAPHFFVTCNAYYEAVFCGLPNNEITPDDIHANQTMHQFRSNPAMEAASCKQNCVAIFQH